MRTLLNLFISVAVALAPIVASAGKPPADEGKALFQKVSPSVVTVEAGDSVGTGFLIRDRKTIVTAAHVISDGDTPFIRVGKSTFMSVEKIAISTEKDIAVLYLGDELKSKPLQLGDKQKVSPGERVYAIGSALGSLTNTLTDGLISSLRESDAMTYIQTTAPFSPGMSGGPVVSPQGSVLGVISFTLSDGQNLNIAVHAKHIRELLEKNPAKTSVVTEALKVRRKTETKPAPTGEPAPIAETPAASSGQQKAKTKALAALYSEIYLQMYILEAGMFDLLMDKASGQWEQCFDLVFRILAETPLLGIDNGKLARESVVNNALLHLNETETRAVWAASLKLQGAIREMTSAASDLIMSKNSSVSKNTYDNNITKYKSSLSDFRALRGKLFETIEDPVLPNIVAFFSECSPFIYSSVGSEFGFYANSLRDDEAVVARVWGETNLERGDVIIGIRFSDEPEFKTVKNWRDFYKHYYSTTDRQKQIIVKLQNGNYKWVQK